MNNRQTEANLAGLERRREIERHNDQGSGRQSKESRLFQSLMRGFKDEATKIESQREGVTDRHRFGGIGETKGRRAFEMSASLGSIAALGIRLPAHA